MGWGPRQTAASIPSRCNRFSVFSIRMKRTAKPVPVKHRPQTARRFHLTESAVLLVYIFVTTPTRHLTCYCAFSCRLTIDIHHNTLTPSPSTAWAAAPRPAFPAFPLGYRFHLDFKSLQRLIHSVADHSAGSGSSFCLICPVRHRRDYYVNGLINRDSAEFRCSKRQVRACGVTSR